MPRMDRLSEYRTTIAANDSGETVVTYVRTPIVAWTHERVRLRSGGYETVTTKRKMNQAARQFNLGFSVYQRDHDWYVTLPTGETVEFRDGMEFLR